MNLLANWRARRQAAMVRPANFARRAARTRSITAPIWRISYRAGLTVPVLAAAFFSRLASEGALRSRTMQDAA